MGQSVMLHFTVVAEEANVTKMGPATVPVFRRGEWRRASSEGVVLRPQVGTILDRYDQQFQQSLGHFTVDF